jgi:hypothetical protein
MPEIDNYLRFEPFSDSGNHTSWSVIYNESYLGQIRWYHPWRRYCLFPRSGAQFDLPCLKEIVSKIGQLMVRAMNA